jgi:dihydropyrimidinase
MTLLIRNGRIVTAVEDGVADILVGDDGRILAIGRDLATPPGTAEHDATGLLVLPGAVDVHTHLEMSTPTARTVDTFATGTRAAAFGGTTTVLDYCTPTPGQRPLQALHAWQGLAERACVDVGAHLILLNADPATLEDLPALVHEHGVSSFKLFMAYPGALMVGDGAMFKALRAAAALGALTCVHAENGAVIQALVDEALAQGRTEPRMHALTRPALAEGEAAQRAITLAQAAGAPLYVVHLSTAEALAAVSAARQRGQPVYAETCPQYLFLDAREYDRPGFEAAACVMSPPLRDAHHGPQLWQGLQRGDLQVVATDHCAFNLRAASAGLPCSKELGLERFTRIPNGAPGVETRLSLMHDGAVVQRGLSLNRLVQWTATAPAKMFGLFPRKGTIAVGSDADLVLWNPDATTTVTQSALHHGGDYSLYEGKQVRGLPGTVLSRGEVIVEAGRFVGEAGRGRFIKRKRYDRSRF